VFLKVTGGTTVAELRALIATISGIEDQRQV
jgi:hypothetical protein